MNNNKQEGEQKFHHIKDLGVCQCAVCTQKTKREEGEKNHE